MQARHIIIMLLLVAVVTILCGCSGTQTSLHTSVKVKPLGSGHYPVEITDNYGRVVTINKTPERIVSLSPSNTETLFALGLGDRIVGRTSYCNYPAEANDKTVVSDLVDVSVEQVIDARPDVIFAQSLTGKEVVDRFQGMGYNTIANDPQNFSEIRDVIFMLGYVMSADDNATKIWDNIDARISKISSVTSKLNDSEKPRVLMLAGYVPGYEIYVYGANTYGDDLIEIAGGNNLAGTMTSWAVMSKEAIIREDPDIIIIPVDNIMTTTEAFEDFKRGNETWVKDLKAVKTGRVHSVDGDTVMRPSPRVADAVEMVAKAIHPELFK